MGNACRVSALEDWSSQNFKDSVVVLQANGEVMKVNRKISAGELMLQFPGHFLCHASSILLRRKSKMIPPKSELQPGKIYLLLPFPASPDSSNCTEQLLQAHAEQEFDQPLLSAPPPAASAGTTPAQGTTKFIISKQYLDRILSEKPGKSTPRKPASSSSSSSKRASLAHKNKVKIRRGDNNSANHNNNNNTGLVQRRSAITWSPALDSIPEK